MIAIPENVALSATEIQELNQQLATMRHDINNYVSLMMAAVELVQRKPEALPRMTPTLVDQPAKIADAVRRFSRTFEARFGIQR